jgi:hypothetical protein
VLFILLHFPAGLLFSCNVRPETASRLRIFPRTCLVHSQDPEESAVKKTGNIGSVQVLFYFLGFIS